MPPIKLCLVLAARQKHCTYRLSGGYRRQIHDLLRGGVFPNLLMLTVVR